MDRLATCQSATHKQNGHFNVETPVTLHGQIQKGSGLLVDLGPVSRVDLFAGEPRQGVDQGEDRQATFGHCPFDRAAGHMLTDAGCEDRLLGFLFVCEAFLHRISDGVYAERSVGTVFGATVWCSSGPSLGVAVSLRCDRPHSSRAGVVI